MRRPNYSQGFSLTELLLVSIIGSLITLSSFEFFSLFRQEVSEVKARTGFVLEVTLLADFMQDLISKSDYLGCINWAKNKHSLRFMQETVSDVQIIDKKTSGIPLSIRRRMLPSTRALMINYQEQAFKDTAIGLFKGSTVIHFNKKVDIRAKDRLLISDCQRYEVLESHHLKDGSSALILKSPLKNDYQTNFQVSQLKTLYVFIGKTSDKRTALFINQNNRSEELAYFVKGMSIDWLNDSHTSLWLKINVEDGKQKDVFPVVLSRFIRFTSASDKSTSNDSNER
jgi:hypothetical protein